MNYDRQLALYNATRETANIFWEWRHKVMTRFFVVAGSTFVAAAWLYNIKDLRRWSWLPFVLGALFSLISYLLDGVNTWILRECYRRASDLEKELFTPDGGFFAAIHVHHYKKGSYAMIMAIVYLSSLVGFVILAVMARNLCK